MILVLSVIKDYFKEQISRLKKKRYDQTKYSFQKRQVMNRTSIYFI